MDRLKTIATLAIVIPLGLLGLIVTAIVVTMDGEDEDFML